MNSYIITDRKGVDMTIQTNPFTRTWKTEGIRCASGPEDKAFSC